MKCNEYHALIMYKLNINNLILIINVNVELKHNVLYTNNKTLQKTKTKIKTIK